MDGMNHKANDLPFSLNNTTCLDLDFVAPLDPVSHFLSPSKSYAMKGLLKLLGQTAHRMRPLSRDKLMSTDVNYKSPRVTERQALMMK